MTDEDRQLLRELIAALNNLALAIRFMPHTITIYDPNHRPPGGYGGGGGTAGGGSAP
jgi:hypothetical protein